MKKTIYIFLILIMLSPLYAETNSVRISVYNRGIAQICETRRFRLEKGDNPIALTDFASGILPETVFLKPLTAGDKIILLSGDYYDGAVNLNKLWANRVNQIVEFTIDSALVKGLLLNVDDNNLYIKPDTGGVKIIKKSDLKNSTFAEIPAGCASAPTLDFDIRNEGKAGESDFELSYLTSGLKWSAYYQAKYQTGQVELTGDFVVENTLVKGFDGAELSLIAGEPHLSNDLEILPRNLDMAEAEPKGVDSQPLFAYYHYPIDYKVDIIPNSKKHLPFIKSKSFPAEEKYLMREGYGWRNLESIISFNTDKTPLPEGKIAVFKSVESGKSSFVGEDQLYDTPPGGKVEVRVGQAFDLQGERKRLSHSRMNRNATEDVIQVRLTNSSAKDANIVVRERVFGVWEISQAQFEGQAVDFKRIDSRKVEFNVVLKKQSTAVLEYTVKYEF